RRELVRLPLCQLRYAEADGRETLLYCTGGVMRVSMSLGKTAEQLPSPPFLRCQKSFLVHTGAISELSGGNVVMSDGRSIPMTRDRSRELAKTVAAWNAARGMEVSVT
ncbi:MAG: LytTR family transcriptional regulator DNA-binding domain-containing protein, partial [Oscillospiraceae bacterium]|nr:LytTR family transcriptional regulator DNA-binding domain-containing protein [Oscillospiraceae bacterium]